MDPIFFAKIRIIIIITMKNGGKNIKHLHFLSLWRQKRTYCAVKVIIRNIAVIQM